MTSIRRKTILLVILGVILIGFSILVWAQQEKLTKLFGSEAVTIEPAGDWVTLPAGTGADKSFTCPGHSVVIGIKGFPASASNGVFSATNPVAYKCGNVFLNGVQTIKTQSTPMSWITAGGRAYANNCPSDTFMDGYKMNTSMNCVKLTAPDGATVTDVSVFNVIPAPADPAGPPINNPLQAVCSNSLAKTFALSGPGDTFNNYLTCEYLTSTGGSVASSTPTPSAPSPTIASCPAQGGYCANEPIPPQYEEYAPVPYNPCQPNYNSASGGCVPNQVCCVPNNMTVEVTPTSRNISSGNSTTYDVKVTSQKSDPMALSFYSANSDLPITYSFNPTTITDMSCARTPGGPCEGTSKLTINASAGGTSTPADTYYFKVRSTQTTYETNKNQLVPLSTILSDSLNTALVVNNAPQQPLVDLVSSNLTATTVTANAQIQYGTSANISIPQSLYTASGLSGGNCSNNNCTMDLVSQLKPKDQLTTIAINLTFPADSQGKTYALILNASGDGGTASDNLNLSPAPDTEAPTAPTNAVAQATGQTTIQLSWTASTDNVGVDHYEIFNADNNQLIASANNTTHNVAGAACNTTYKYYIVAVDAAGNRSSHSNTANATTLACNANDSEAPSTPADLKISNPTIAGKAPDCFSAGLSWTTSTDNIGVTGYNVYNASNDQLIGTTQNVNFTLTGLKESTNLGFYVKATDAAGNTSQKSNSATFTTGKCVTTMSAVAATTSGTASVTNLVKTGSALWLNILIALLATAAVGYFLFRDELWGKR